MRLTAAVVALLLCGCASARTWERAATVGMAADVVSTQIGLRDGGREANPLMGGGDPVVMVTANAALHAIIKASLRGSSECHQRNAWRIVAIVRFAAAAWNLSRR